MANLKERGQVMLLAGFVLATAFIALALVLNSVIYTENLATRDSEARGSEAIDLKSDVVDGTEKLIEFENRNITVGSETYSNIEAKYNRSLEGMKNGTMKIQAVDGERVQLSNVSTTEGTRFGQQNASRNFTNINGVSTWVLATDVDGLRAFEINVTDSDQLRDAGSGGVPFNVSLIGSSANRWSVNVTNVSGSPNTRLTTSSGVTCSLGGPDPDIDIIAGTIDGEQCPDYEFAEGLSKPYASLEFIGAQNITGNFSLVANTTSFSSGNYDADTDSPFNASAIYSAEIHVIQESADIVYETDARALPGESDE